MIRPQVDDPRIVEPPSAVSIVAIAAHPDDIERWCAGTLARSIEAGATVRLLLVTSGDSGSSDPHATRETVRTHREREARIAADRLGISEVTFLREPDGAVENTASLRGALVKWIRCWRPDVLFTHDPEYPDPPYLSHRDHRVVGRAALDGEIRKLSAAHKGQRNDQLNLSAFRLGQLVGAGELIRANNRRC